MQTNLFDPHAQLEMLYIGEYLKSKGYMLNELELLSEEMAHRLMKEASQYASAKLTNLEMRSEMMHELVPEE